MARRVFLSPAATRDLGIIRAWLGQPGAGPRAKERARRIARVLRSLAERPFLGHPGDEPGTRELVVEQHTIIYQVENDTGLLQEAGDVDVLRVWMPRQNRS
ncbi:type II toxin-antitoxin system RelE/ParE family toxin [Azospirillum rugosum]|uniref:Plasmid stabilization system protein ParE n=1 Tax=Azospirillum rugosum TaxID=416170 RepID=A0ABS4SCV0_9PROT|nr:type II toxin-antitoxin system RelE/ParE family toxin [Azospirillum rugosum]MBP2290391.1 plasmid stabilization system protein ParE [Azospirillum rugosum]MDQ0527867.1 plasmid stabilization system protein ParE [Azospirillum rugosum]